MGDWQVSEAGKVMDPPVRVSVNRIDVVSGSLFFANITVVPALIFAIFASIIMALFLPIWFPDMGSVSFLPIWVFIIGFPAASWIANFIWGAIFLLISNGIMKFNKPKLLMQQI